MQHSDGIEITIKVPGAAHASYWLAFIQRVSFRHAPLGITFTVEPGYAGGFLMATIKVPDILDVNGKLVGILRTTPLPAWPGDSAAASYLSRMAVELMEHEFQEQLLIDGKHVFSPHGEAR